MTALTWDATGARTYETGVDWGVLYRLTAGQYDTGFAWNGLTTVTESPSGAEATSLYADNIKYLTLLSYEEFGFTIEAYTYPDEFGACDGTAAPEAGVLIGQQPRAVFGFSYRSRVGNDSDAQYGYKLHLIYGCLAAPSEKAYSTINDSPEAITFSWDVSSTPVAVSGGYKPVSSITIDSTKVNSAALATLESILYGSVGEDPRLPSPDDVLAIFAGTVTTTALPTAPTYNSTTDIVTIPSITGVQYYTDADGDLAPGAMATPITANTVFKARPQAGYKFPTTSVDEWLIVFA